MKTRSANSATAPRMARFAHVLLGVLAAAYSPQPAVAVTRTWIAPASSTSWSGPNNWSPVGVPQTGDEVRTAKNSSTANTLIDYDFNTNVVVGLASLTLSQTNNFTEGRYSSILSISANGLWADAEYLGDSSVFLGRTDNFAHGRIDQSGGGNTTQHLSLGRMATDFGSYNLSGNGNLTTTEVLVGEFGTGSITQSGGIHSVSDFLDVGAGHGATGTYTLNDGYLIAVLDEVFNEFIGSSGSGTFNQSGGTNSPYSLFLGHYPGSTGIYNLHNGTLTADNESIGFSGDATFNQSGGSNQVTRVGIGCDLNSPCTNATYNLTGGSLTAADVLVGYINGEVGTFTFNSPATLDVSGDVSIYPGSALVGDGNTLASVRNLGAISPGNSPKNSTGTLTIGTLTAFAGSHLKIELAGTTPATEYDQLHIIGVARFDGTLNVSLTGDFTPASGNSFDILDWAASTGTFQDIQLPTLANGLQWNTSELYTMGRLSVTTVDIPGDYNHNGTADAADYVVWRKTDGTPAGYNAWRTHFGQMAGSGAGAAAESAVVPEPATVVLLMLAATGCYLRRRGACISSLKTHQRVTLVDKPPS